MPSVTDLTRSRVSGVSDMITCANLFSEISLMWLSDSRLSFSNSWAYVLHRVEDTCR